jgi:DNA-binding CsgD family transcriptional regulator
MHKPLEMAVPAGRSSSPDAALGLTELQLQVVTALREVLNQAERGDLHLAPALPSGMAVATEHGNVRCVLIVGIPDDNRGLSPREMQIARLVADGATNRAMATMLGISLWTVSTHLRRIFAKLGVSSRAEMVATLFGEPHLPAGL